MRKPLQIVFCPVLTRVGYLFPLLLCGVLVVGQVAPAPSAISQTKQQAVNPSANPPAAPGEKAWGILHEALKDENADKRAKAVHALGLLTGNTEAEKATALALKDEKSSVRLAAAVALT